MNQVVEKEIRERIAIVRLNRPSSYNAIDMDMAKGLAETLIRVSSDNTIKGVVITGAGKAFCSGGDLRWISQQGERYDDTFYRIVGEFNRAIIEIKNMKKPVFAAINGMAAGGGFSLALSCDFRIMESQANLILAYTSRGLSIDGGGTFTLPRIVGISKALEIVAFDRPISSEEALRLGLVNEVVEEGRSVERSVELIKQILNKVSLNSYVICKRLFYESFFNPLELQLEREREEISLASEHPDGKEGIGSFLEKREPVYNKD